MKKFFAFFALATLACGAASAQYAGEYDLGNKNSDFKGYNRIGISYNNAGFSPNDNAKDWLEVEKSFSLNGFGIDYIHGFSINSALPMFIETGANINFNFGNMDSGDERYEGETYSWKTEMQNINLQVPVNYVYRFNVMDNFSIAPYVGLNFKLNFLSRLRYVEEYDGEKDESKWLNLFSKKDMGEDGKWNVFQMGWHVGVGFQYDSLHLGIQYGTDFIPAFNYKEDGYKYTVNTGNLKISLSYAF